MANLSAAIRQVRRARQRLDAPTTENVERYRAEYEVILEEVADIAGDPAFEALKQWIIEITEDRKQLPTPAAVRKQAREICQQPRGQAPWHPPRTACENSSVAVPRQSPLHG